MLMGGGGRGGHESATFRVFTYMGLCRVIRLEKAMCEKSQLCARLRGRMNS